MNKSTSKIVSGFKWSYLNTITKIILQLIVVSILAHLLLPKDFGLLSISFIFVNLADMISQLGISPALIQKKELTGEHIRVGFTLIVLFSAVFASLLFVFAPFIALFFKTAEVVPVLRCISLIYIIRSLGVVSRALLQRKMMFKEIMIIDVSAYIFGYGFIGIVLAFLGYGVWALVFASLFQSSISVLFCYFFSRHSLIPLFGKQEISELLNFGGGYTILSVFNYIARNGDNFIVGKFLGAKMLGIYSRAYALMTMPATYFASVLDKVLFPAMSKIQDENLRLRKIILSGIELNAFISLIVSVYIFFLSSDIIIILLGRQWLEAVPVLKIMSLGVLFRSGYKINDSLIRAKGAVYGGALRHGVYAFLIITGAYIGSFYGISYVAIGVVFALFVHYFFISHLGLKLTNTSWKDFFKSHYFPLKTVFLLSVFFFFSLSYIKQYNIAVFPRFISIVAINSLFLMVLLLLFPKYFIGDGIKWILVKAVNNDSLLFSVLKKIIKL